MKNWWPVNCGAVGACVLVMGIDVGYDHSETAALGEPHTFANLSETDVPVLMFVTPAGFERYFAKGAAQARPPDKFTIIVGGRLDEVQASVTS